MEQRHYRTMNRTNGDQRRRFGSLPQIKHIMYARHIPTHVNETQNSSSQDFNMAENLHPFDPQWLEVYFPCLPDVGKAV